MDALTANLPAIISAAAQSYLGILALLSVALSVLAYFFFARASDKIKVGIFVLLFLGVAGFAAAVFQAAATAQTPLISNAAKPASLSKEAKLILKKASADPAGIITFEHFGGGVDLQTNGESFITDQSRQVIATWEAALQELVDGQLLVVRDKNGEVFEITKKGYDAAEHISL
ncbi:MAG: hypothetical protein JWM78_3133 [Verrucomicrobiaceae bacterium]|nr:hypothetical protein [Verrucomicrobiaceae bacterium]